MFAAMNCGADDNWQKIRARHDRNLEAVKASECHKQSIALIGL